MDGVTASVSQCTYSECEPQLECCRTLHLSGKATEEKEQQQGPTVAREC